MFKFSNCIQIFIINNSVRVNEMWIKNGTTSFYQKKIISKIIAIIAFVIFNELYRFLNFSFKISIS